MRWTKIVNQNEITWEYDRGDVVMQLIWNNNEESFCTKNMINIDRVIDASGVPATVSTFEQIVDNRLGIV